MQKTTSEALAKRMKEEIEKDAADGLISKEIWTIGDLNHFVDANKYGGLTDDKRLDDLVQEFGGREEDGSLPTGLTNVITEAENIVNAWLAEGGLAGVPLKPQHEMTRGPWGACAALSSDTDHIRYISGPDGQHIAKVERPLGMSQEEALLNAKAIKAAPEMVDLLREAALMLKAHPEFVEGNSKVHYLAHKCQGILNKIK